MHFLFVSEKTLGRPEPAALARVVEVFYVSMSVFINE